MSPQRRPPSLPPSLTHHSLPVHVYLCSFADYALDANCDGRPVELSLCDPNRLEDLFPLRPRAGPDPDIYVICFSLVDPNSLTNVADKWAPEKGHRYTYSVPTILVGTKLDLRDDPAEIERLHTLEQSPITTAEGEAMRERIAAHAYVECSAWHKLVCRTSLTRQWRPYCSQRQKRSSLNVGACQAASSVSLNDPCLLVWGISCACASSFRFHRQ